MQKNRIDPGQILLNLLQKYELQLPTTLMDQLLQKSILKNFHKEELLLQMNEENDYVYFIISGCVRSFFLSNDGKDMTRYIIRAGELCAEEVLLGKSESNYNIEALEDGCLLLLPCQFMRKIIMGDTNTKDIYIKKLEEALLYKMKREQSFMVLDAKERYL